MRLLCKVLVYLGLPILVLGCIPLKPSGYYLRDGKVFYFVNNVFEDHENQVSDVEFRSFRILENKVYASDNLNVYWKGQRIRGANSDSFKALKDDFSTDKANVYYQNIVILGAAPTTFQVLQSPSMVERSQWGRDAKDVYFRGKAINACDPTTFSPLEDQWSRDSKCVYTNYTKKVPEIDATTFSGINSFCAKDKNGFWSTLIGEYPSSKTAIPVDEKRCKR